MTPTLINYSVPSLGSWQVKLVPSSSANTSCKMSMLLGPDEPAEEITRGRSAFSSVTSSSSDPTASAGAQRTGLVEDCQEVIVGGQAWS